jgi:hypothetical protein
MLALTSAATSNAKIKQGLFRIWVEGVGRGRDAGWMSTGDTLVPFAEAEN